MKPKDKIGVFDDIDRRAVAWGWVIALFGIKMFWVPGSTINLLVNCTGVREHTPDVYSKIFWGLIPSFNGWSSLICVALGAASAAWISKRLKAKQALFVLGLAAVSYPLMVAVSMYLRPSFP